MILSSSSYSINDNLGTLVSGDRDLTACDYHYYAKDHPLTNNHYYYDAKDYHLCNELKIIIYKMS